MTRMVARTKFHSSKLIRCLADLDIVDPVDAGNAFAEKLGQWIHFADAITLSAVHNSGIADTPTARLTMAASPSDAVKAQAAARAAAEFERIQALLIQSIVKSCSPGSAKSHIELPEPPVDLPLNLVAAYVPYRRFYEAHQRDMELSIEPLRTNVREAMAKASARLKKLAELDATLDRTLRERERQLLAKVPLLLRKRFEQLFREHQQQLNVTQQLDNPANWTRGQGWLARFHQEMEMLLLAEAELRLQPALGLIEGFKQDTQ